MSSLCDMMNDMAAHPDRVQSIVRNKAERPAVKSRIDAWLAVDPLLADLYKQFLDAQSYNRKVLNRHRADQPMAVVAADMEDSAHSAFRTRLLEIRRDRILRRRVLALLCACRREQEKKKHEALQEAYRRQGWLRDVRREAADSFSFAMFLWWMLYFVLENTRRSLSLAQEFGVASATFGDPERVVNAA